MTELYKDWKPSHTPTASEQLAGRVDELRSTLRLQDPVLVAARSGSSYLMLGPDRGEIHITLWRDVCVVSFPELIGYNNKDERVPDFKQALFLYYLLTADGEPLTGRWVSFADLPGGRMYNTAFQGYSGDEVVKIFGLELDGFRSACMNAGGEPIEVGSASFVFLALPCVPLMLTYWLGDEDFPSSCKVLFDESACHYLPIDACAILGSMLTQKVTANAKHTTAE